MLTSAAGAQEAKHKNVLFIAVDDMKPILGCYGDAVAISPNIDSLAADGHLFRRAYCQQAVSGPTRASLLTGLRPEEVGVTELGTYMRAKNPDVVTLPQAFREAGYETRGVGKIFHGSQNSLDKRSWSRRPMLYNYSRTDEYQLDINKTGKKARATEFTDAPDSLYFDVRVRNEALSQLDELSRSQQPFFLAVGFLKPHLPFCAPQKYLDLYADADMAVPEADRGRPVDVPMIAYHNSEELRGYTDIPDLGPLSPEQEAELRRAYYACVSFTDANIGAVIDRLKQLGLYDNTVIVLWGDHGYHLGEQDLWCKSTTYEAACNAPLIIKEAAQQKGRNMDEVVEFLDIYPTMLDMCSIDTSHEVSGQSLLPLMKGKRVRPRYAVSQFQRPYPALTNLKNREYMGYVIRDARWAYTEWVDLDGELIARELYDMSGSRFENKNLSGLRSSKSTEKRMSKALHKILNGQKGRPDIAANN